MGTGYSTIDLLLHLAADEIKLDMTFTRELQGIEKHEILTHTLCAAAAKSNVDICFEGVETAEMTEYLKGYGDRRSGETFSNGSEKERERDESRSRILYRSFRTGCFFPSAADRGGLAVSGPGFPEDQIHTKYWR